MLKITSLNFISQNEAKIILEESIAIESIVAINKKGEKYQINFKFDGYETIILNLSTLPDFGMYGFLVDDEYELMASDVISITEKSIYEWKYSKNARYFIQSKRPSISKIKREIVVTSFEFQDENIVISIPKKVELKSPKIVLRHVHDSEQEDMIVPSEIENHQIKFNYNDIPAGPADEWFIFLNDDNINFRLYSPRYKGLPWQERHFVTSVNFDNDLENIIYFSKNSRLAYKTRKISYRPELLDIYLKTLVTENEADINKTPLLSIIVPFYNVENYLGRTLISLLIQGLSLDKYEVLMIDDLGTDDSVEIAEKFAEKFDNFKLIHHDQNKGLGAGRNTGVAHSKGDYIYFIDSDDWLRDGFLGKIWSEIENMTSDYISFGVERYDEDKKIFYKSTYSEIIWSQERRNIQLEDFPYLVWDTASWNKIIDKNFYITSQISFPEDNILYEDLETITDLQQKAKTVTVLPEYAYVWRVRSGKAAASITQTLTQYMTVFDRLNVAKQTLEKINSPILLNEVLIKIYLLDFVMLIRRNLSDHVNLIMIRDALKFVMTTYDKENIWYKLPINVSELLQNVLDYQLPSDQLYKLIPNRLPSVLNTNGKKFKYFYNDCSIQKNIVVYDTFYASNVNGNPRIVLEKLLELDVNKVLQHYFIIKEKDFPIIYANHDIFKKYDNVHVVAYNSQAWINLLATAEYLVINTSLPYWYIKREGQKIIQTWHGIPLKKIASQEENTFFGYKNVTQSLLKTDYLLVQNQWTEEQLIDAYQLELMENLKVGYVSWEYEKYEYYHNRKIFTSNNKKRILYVPTWRYDKEEELAIYTEVVEALLKLENVEVYLKGHLNASSSTKKLRDEYSNLKAITEDIETIIGNFDLVITDYSSVFFSAIPYKIPILLLQNDENYFETQGIHKGLNNQFSDFILTDLENISQKSFELLNIGKVDYETCYPEMYNSLFKLGDLTALLSEIFEFKKCSITKQIENFNEYQILRLPKLNSESLDEIQEILDKHKSFQDHTILLLEGIYTVKDVDRLKIFTGWHTLNRSGALDLSYDEKTIYNTNFITKSYSRTGNYPQSLLKRLVKNELRRVLPGIKIKKIENYSDLLVFKGED